MDNQFKRKRLHIILPGGGVRGAFQGGFIYHLFSNYGHKIEVVKVDGTSVGSINGFALMNKNMELLKDTWLSIDSINDLFDNWSDSYIMNKIKNYYWGFFNNGLFSNKKLLDMLERNYRDIWNVMPIEWKRKFECAVVNLDIGKTEYFSGDNDDIFKYVTASASPWIVSNPININGTLYSDGALLETYPIKNIGKIDNIDYTIILGFDQEHLEFVKPENNNLLEYLANLIDIARYNSQNTYYVRQLLLDPKILSIVNPMKLSFVNFNKESIEEGFRLGEELAENFYKTFLE